MDINEAIKKVKRQTSLNIPHTKQKQSVTDNTMRPYSHNEKKEQLLKSTPPKNKNVGTQENTKKIAKNPKEKQGNNKGTTREQQENSKGTIREQQGNNKGTTREQQGNSKGTINSQQKDVLREQSNYTFINQAGSKNLSRISQQQTKIMVFIFNRIINNNGHNTGAVIYNEICSDCGISYETMKVQIKRLINKNLLYRMPGKKGKGGYTIFRIDKEVYSELHFLREQNNILNPINKGTNTSLSSSSNINTTTKLYENINLENIKKALNCNHVPNGQFFDKGNLKVIFNANGGELTPEQIQLSIDSFAYGLEHCFDTPPYNTMKEPGAVLFKKLKAGDTWDEPRYLTPSELELKKYYDNICVAFLKNEKQHFESWLKTNRDEMFKKFKAKLSSTYHLSDSEFMDKAVKEFKESVLPELKISHALGILGEDKKELLQKIERLKLN